MDMHVFHFTLPAGQPAAVGSAAASASSSTTGDDGLPSASSSASLESMPDGAIVYAKTYILGKKLRS